MPTVLTEHYGSIHVPPGVHDLAAFRRWVHFADLPEKLPVHFLRGDVWLDCARSNSLAEVLLRGELGAVLGTRAKSGRSGTYLLAGMLWSNDEAGFATLPDGLFVRRETLRAGRVRFSNGGNPKAVATEVIGTPDVVVEIVSNASEEKDEEWLMSAYAEAGVPEYWLIDARDEGDLRFTIYNRGKKEFAATRKSGGWVKSAVLGQSFRLTQAEGADGNPEFTLEVR